MLGERLVGSEEIENGKLKIENFGKGKPFPDGDSSSLSEKFTTGLALLPVVTEFCPQKALTRVTGTVRIDDSETLFSSLSGISVSGYEIHQGRTKFSEGVEPAYFAEITDGVSGESKLDGAVSGNVFGTYIHGLFDEAEFTTRFVKILAKRKGFDWAPYSQSSCESQIFNENAHSPSNLRDFKESQYNLLAKTLREHLDMKKIYEIMGLEKPKGGKKWV